MMNLQFQSINQNRCFGKTCVILLTEVWEVPVNVYLEKRHDPLKQVMQGASDGLLLALTAVTEEKQKYQSDTKCQDCWYMYIYISLKDECDTATNKHEKQRGNLVSFTFFFFFLNCKMQSIKIDNMHKWHKKFFHFSWLQTMLFIRLSPLQSNNTSKEDCSFNSFKMKNIGLSRIL